MNRRIFLTALGAIATRQKLANLTSEQVGAGEPTTTKITTFRFPYVQNVRNDRASILWATLEPGTGILEYSPDGVNFIPVPARSRAYTPTDLGLPTGYVQHQANLTGLNPGTDYVYRATVNGQQIFAGGEQRFHTAGPGGFNFLVLGDSGYGAYDEQALIAKRLATEKAALLIHTGDVVYPQGGNGWDAYQRFYFNYNASAMANTPFYPCMGNHDYTDVVPNGAAYWAVHALPTEGVPAADRGKYYSFDWGNTHFISIDSHLSLPKAVSEGGGMLRWLENDLRTTQQFWRIAYFHYPPWATGINQNDSQSQLARQYLIPLFEKYGVQVVIGGHEHSYQRARPQWKNQFVDSSVGVNYLTSGGGGAFLYDVFPSTSVAFGKSEFHYVRGEVRGTKITFRSIRYDGTELENFVIAPKPVFSDDTSIPPASLTPGPVAGATIRIFGRGLATEETFVCTPAGNPGTAAVGTLAGVRVTVNGRDIQVLYASPTQVYGILPFAVSGNVTLRIETANGFSEMSL